MVACTHCGEENNIELILMADFIIDEETGDRMRCIATDVILVRMSSMKN